MLQLWLWPQEAATPPPYIHTVSCGSSSGSGSIPSWGTQYMEAVSPVWPINSIAVPALGCCHMARQGSWFHVLHAMEVNGARAMVVREGGRGCGEQVVGTNLR